LVISGQLGVVEQMLGRLSLYHERAKSALKKFKIGWMWESVETYAPSVLQNDSLLLKSIVFPFSQGNAFNLK
jgi:hypothetical protein